MRAHAMRIIVGGILIGLLSCGPASAGAAPAGASSGKRDPVGWEYSSKHKTAHFVIYSGLSPETTKQVGKVSEAGYAAFSREYVKIIGGRKLSAPVKIFLFPDTRSWKIYLLRNYSVRPPGGAVSTYNSLLKLGLYCRAGSDDSRFLATVLHENTHALVHQLAGMDPLQLKNKPGFWVHEAWACSMQCALDSDGKVKPGIMRFPAALHPVRRTPYGDRIAHLSFTSGISLKRLLGMTGPEFNRGTIVTYAEGWAFFHFLMYGGTKYKSGLMRFLKRSLHGRYGLEVFEREVAPLKEIEPEWKAFRKKLIKLKKERQGGYVVYKLPGLK